MGNEETKNGNGPVEVGVKENVQAGVKEKTHNPVAVLEKRDQANVLDLTTAKAVPDPDQFKNGNNTSGPGEVKVEYAQAEGVPPELTGPIRWDHPQAAHVKILDAEKGIVERKRSKVCIVGYAENSRHLAWYDDPDCEIWGVNQLNRFIPRADRWFQIHKDWRNKSKWATGTDQAEFLKNCPIPVYMMEVQEDVPNSVKYPLDRVMKDLGTHDYFTSTIAFMVALAIAEGFKEIGIYGIDLIIGREYFFEKACVEFYLGVAHARGINYHKPEGCALLWQSHRYGYEMEPDYGFFGLEKLQLRAAQLNAAVVKLRDEVALWQGRAEEAEYIRNRLNPEALKNMDEHIADLRLKVDKALNKLYLHDGAAQEIKRMADILEVKSRGGQVS